MNRTRSISTASRSLVAARLHLVVAARALTWSWGLLAGVFALNLLVIAAVNPSRSVVISGGLSSFHIWSFAAAVMAVTRLLPVAVGLGLTRRAYYAGTCLCMAAHSLAAGALFALLRSIEQATDGWGVGVQFFDLAFLAGGSAPAAALGFAASVAVACAAGLACGAVSRRWGTLGAIALGGILSVVPGLLAWWITRNGWWSSLRDWYDSQPPLALYALWPAVLAATLTALAFLGVRKAQILSS